MNLAFDPATELARYETGQDFQGLRPDRRPELGGGMTFQPGTAESAEDQVVETLWAEGMTLETAPPEDVTEARASFAVLAPRREHGGQSLVATLFLGFPDAVRDAKLAALQRFPDQLRLELSDGSLVAPAVDRGAAGPEDRLPAVLALRFFIPDGCSIAALVSYHAVVPGRWSAPPTWDAWPS